MTAVKTTIALVDMPIVFAMQWNDWSRVFLLQDYNTRVVVLATTLLGLAAGLVGSFTLLRKRALLGDALSHATLPGIGLAFLLAPTWGLDGKSLAVLLSGAAISGLVGTASIIAIRNLTKLKEDAALGIVLSVFFGGGLVVLGIAQQRPEGHAAGLESFIYGKTASIIAQDGWWIAATAGCTIAILSLFYKELKLLCFDEGFASSRGYPIVGLDILLMATVVIVTIVGLQAVGLVLMIALLVIPAAASRFWTSNMRRMTLLSAALGAGSCMAGSLVSALLPDLPSGALIVLVSASAFAFSMFFGQERGVIARYWRRMGMQQRLDRRYLMRGLYELLEPSFAMAATPESGAAATNMWIPTKQLLATRTWPILRFSREINRLKRDGFIRARDGEIALTATGLLEAKRFTREHRLWELYLITHADVAAERVDRDAERIEDCLEPIMIHELESLLNETHTDPRLPVSPHQIELPSTLQASAVPVSNQTKKGAPQ